MRHRFSRLRAASVSGVALVALTAAIVAGPFSVSAASADPSAPTTLADAYNGGSSASTADDSCATTTCAAVGTFTTSALTTVPFVSVNTGTSWVTTPVPVASGTGTVVQCPSDSFCVAAGTSGSAPSTTAWVGTWNGQAWQFSPVTGDLGATSISAVTSLSCSSSTQCALGGTFVDANGLYQGFVSLFDGNVWSSTPVATSLNPGGDGQVLGISCASDGSCTAVGYVSTGSLSYQGFSDQYVNGTWTTALIGTDISMMASSVATSVVCSVANSCEVGGYVTDATGAQQALVGAWSGTSWTDQALGTTLNVDGLATVTALSCSASSCGAVGNFLDGNGQSQPFAANLEGGHWTAGPIGQLSGETSGSGQSVNCLSTDQCVAGGYVIDSAGATQAFSSVFDGVTWTDSALFAQQNGGGNAQASAVSCSSQQCVVAGTFAASLTSSQAAVQSFPLSAQSPLVFAGPFTNPALTSVNLNGSGGSGQSLEQFSTSSTGCSITNGTLSATTLGPCVVTVTNPANGLYTAASAQQTYTFTPIAPASLAIHATARPIAGTPLKLTVVGGNGQTSFSYATTTPWCRVRDGALSSTVPGVCVVTAQAAATGVYQAGSGTASFTFAAVAQQPLRLTATQTRTTGRSVRLSITGGSGLRHITYTVGGASCHVAAGVVSATRDTTCSVRAHNLSNGKYGPVSSSTLYVVFSRK